MIEILWHGRGGQGAFTAARLLGAAASMSDGAYALAFPSFGPERRGAPMRAFTKISTEPIGDRSAISRADFVIYLDDTLLSQNWDIELKPGGYALVNSRKTYDDPRIVAIDANGISEEILGRSIPNTVFLGALSVLCESVSPGDVVSAIRQYMPAKLHEKNERIVAHTRRLLLGRAAGAVAGAAKAPAAAAGDVSRETSPCNALVDADERAGVFRSCAHIPRLRSQFAFAPSLDPAEYARTTCYAAGHLVAKNAGWRNIRPVVDASACTGCLQCYLYCPDGAVFKTPDAVAAVAVDYDFCKGCGVCVKACRFDALRMISESEASVSRETLACENGAKTNGSTAEIKTNPGTESEVRV